MMFRHTRPEDGTVEICANNKLDSAGIAIWRGSLNDGRYGFIILASDKNTVCAFAEGGRIDQITALLQIIIVTIWRQYLIEQGMLLLQRLFVDG